MKNNRFYSLLFANAKQGAYKAEGNVIYIYDVIVSSDVEAEWFGGVSPEAFSKTLMSMNGDVDIRINSPGGDVFAARAMAAAMANYPGTITAYVDGYAASAASILAVSAKRTVMAKGSMMMIHKAWTYQCGNADDFLSASALLEKIDQTLCQTYADKSGRKPEEFMPLLTAETWFTPEEAIAIGLANELAGDASQTQNKAPNWDLSAYEKVPASAQKPAPKEPDPSQDQAAPSAADDTDHAKRIRIHEMRMRMTESA